MDGWSRTGCKVSPTNFDVFQIKDRAKLIVADFHLLGLVSPANIDPLNAVEATRLGIVFHASGKATSAVL